MRGPVRGEAVDGWSSSGILLGLRRTAGAGVASGPRDRRTPGHRQSTRGWRPPRGPAAGPRRCVGAEAQMPSAGVARAVVATAAAEQQDRQCAGRGAHAVGPARDVVVELLAAGDDDDPRLVGREHVAQAGETRDRQRQGAQADARGAQLQRPQRQGVGIELRRAWRRRSAPTAGPRRRRQALGAAAATRRPSGPRTPTAPSRSRCDRRSPPATAGAPPRPTARRSAARARPPSPRRPAPARRPRARRPARACRPRPTPARGKWPTRSTAPPGARRAARRSHRACRGGACRAIAAASGSRNGAPTHGACSG